MALGVTIEHPVKFFVIAEGCYSLYLGDKGD